MGNAHVRVGVAALVADGERLLVLRRAGAHGAGTWAVGPSVPFDVTLFVECAVRAGEARIAEPTNATDVAWLTPAELRERDLFAPLRRWLDANGRCVVPAVVTGRLRRIAALHRLTPPGRVS